MITANTIPSYIQIKFMEKQIAKRPIAIIGVGNNAQFVQENLLGFSGKIGILRPIAITTELAIAIR